MISVSRHLLLSAAVLFAFGATEACAAESASPADKAFVAKVSQGGMFEVALGKVASDKGDAQMIKDNGVTEAHDHELVGAKLKAVATAAGIDFPAKLNDEFQGRLDKLSALSGKAFDTAYVTEMERIHALDGGLFAKEAKEGSGDFKAFAVETHSIVLMHVGALKGTGIAK
jgi:putative membrane protein